MIFARKKKLQNNLQDRQDFERGHASMKKLLRNFQPFIFYIQFHFRPCAQHAFALRLQRFTNGRRSYLHIVVFLTPCSCSLGPWSHNAALWKVFENSK